MRYRNAILAAACLAAGASSAASFRAGTSAELIDAMEQAAARPGADTIRLVPNRAYDFSTEYRDGLALPPVGDALRIKGRGATLRWTGATPSALFHVRAGGRLKLLGTNLTGSTAGAIIVDGELILHRARVFGNRYQSENGSSGTLTINTGGTARVSQSVIEHNSVEGGNAANTVAGIYNAGDLYASGVTFRDNHAIIFFAGGLSSSVPDRAVFNPGRSRLVNSTFKGNYIVNSGSIRLIHATVMDSHLFNEDQGRFLVRGSAILNDRVALSSDSHCANLTSLGHNVFTADCRLRHGTDRMTVRTREGVPNELTYLDGLPLAQPDPESPLVDAVRPDQCPGRDATGRARPVDGNHDGAERCDVGAVELDPGTYEPDGRVVGLWFEPDRDGHFLKLEQPEPGRATVFWATYDAAGNPLWLFGSGAVKGNRLSTPLTLQRGMRFGSFERDDLSISQWGDMEIEFRNCAEFKMSWQANGNSALDGETTLTRLTQVRGKDCLP